MTSFTRQIGAQDFRRTRTKTGDSDSARDIERQGLATGGPRAITDPQDIISGPPDYSEVILFVFIF